MVDRFQVVAQGFAADGNTVLDDLGGLAKRTGIALDRVRGIGEFNVVKLLQLRERLPRQRA